LVFPLPPYPSDLAGKKRESLRRLAGSSENGGGRKRGFPPPLSPCEGVVERGTQEGKPKGAGSARTAEGKKGERETARSRLNSAPSVL